MSIRFRISLYLSIVLFLGFSFLAVVNSVISYDNLKSEVESNSAITSERWSLEVKDTLDSAMFYARGFRSPLIFTSPARESIIVSIKEVIERNPNFLPSGWSSNRIYTTAKIPSIKAHLHTTLLEDLFPMYFNRAKKEKQWSDPALGTKIRTEPGIFIRYLKRKISTTFQNHIVINLKM